MLIHYISLTETNTLSFFATIYKNEIYTHFVEDIIIYGRLGYMRITQSFIIGRLVYSCTILYDNLLEWKTDSKGFDHSTSGVVDAHDTEQASEEDYEAVVGDSAPVQSMTF